MNPHEIQLGLEDALARLSAMRPATFKVVRSWSIPTADTFDLDRAIRAVQEMRKQLATGQAQSRIAESVNK